MLTEQGNDVYCAKQVTFSERGVGSPCSWGVVVNSQALGGDRWSRASYCNWSVNTQSNLIDSW